MNQYSNLINEIKRIYPQNPFINQFNKRINKGKCEQKFNPTSHLCAFFLPVHIPSKSMFLVHHKKANLWISPGGHIEPNEKPEETIRREYIEELSYELKEERIELFDISVFDVSESITPCKFHYDFWFAVYMKKQIPFRYDLREFYSAKWIDFKDVSGTVERKLTKQILERFINKF
jgi:8-oxo-dGTP pyrophosphatase MutT (NUDIX family)